jgi:hypothetical protein
MLNERRRELRMTRVGLGAWPPEIIFAAASIENQLRQRLNICIAIW